MDTRPFHFKAFSLFHHRSTMKVGSDAIVLGIWTNTENISRALDVGTGSGIISLLIASRSSAAIDAIDIDDNSIEEAKENFKKSLYADRLNAELNDFKNFICDNNGSYDLVVSNPPFFTSDLQSSDIRKTKTRHNISLNYHELCAGSYKVLNNSGSLNVVIPYFKHKEFIDIANENSLFLKRKLLIFPKRGSSPNRVNMEFSKEITKQLVNEYFIIREENNNFTDQYHEWLSNYYLSIPKQ